MVTSCCINGCSNLPIKGGSHRFFLIPKVIEYQGSDTKELSEKRPLAWLAKINLTWVVVIPILVQVAQGLYFVAIGYNHQRLLLMGH